MLNINSKSELKMTILQLEDKQAREWPILKAEVLKTVDGLKPVNFIKNSFKEVVASNEIKESLLVSAVGLTAGFASKALIVGNSTHPLKKLFGTLVQLALTKLVTKNPDTVKHVSENVLKFIHQSNKK